MRGLKLALEICVLAKIKTVKALIKHPSLFKQLLVVPRGFTRVSLDSLWFGVDIYDYCSTFEPQSDDFSVFNLH